MTYTLQIPGHPVLGDLRWLCYTKLTGGEVFADVCKEERLFLGQKFSLKLGLLSSQTFTRESLNNFYH